MAFEKEAVGRLLIENVDRSRWVDFESVHIESAVKVKGSLLSFSMSISNFEINEPKAGNAVVLDVYAVDDWDFDTSCPKPGTSPLLREFSGTIAKIKKRILAPPNTFIYDCECRDWTAWLDRKLVTTEIPEGINLIEAVWAVLADVAKDDVARNYYGAIYSGIDFGCFFNLYVEQNSLAKFQSMEAIPRAAYSFVRASDVFNDICEATGFQWYIDAYRRIVFFDRELGMSAPVGDEIYEISAFEADPDKIAVYSDLEIIDDISDVKNVYRFGDLSVPTDERTVLVTRQIEDATWWQKLVLFLLKMNVWYWISPSYRDWVFSIQDYYYVPKTVTSEEIEQTIRLWVVDLDAFTDETNPAFEDIEQSKVREITNFQVVEKGYQLDYLKSQSNTAFYCPETGEIILTTDLIDWNTQGVYLTGPGISVEHVEVSEFPAIEEMQRREHSCGIYEEYLNAADFPLTWSTGEIFERLAARNAYPRYLGNMISYVPGWVPGMKFKFIGRNIWKMEIDFYVISVEKTFSSDRIMRTELSLSSNLYN